MIKITIITVCFNSVDTIEETIKSVIDQTYNNIEYIIIDGGSTDGTIDIIKKYADRIAYWVSEPDKGIYDAMNKGIEAATGDYVLFLGADDTLYEKDLLNKVAYIIAGGKRNIVYYGDVIFRPSGKRYMGKFSKWTLIKHNICHQAIFYPSIILKKHPYNMRYKTYADYYENILLWGKGVDFFYLSAVISNFNTTGFSGGGDKMFDSEKGQIIKHHLGVTEYIYYLLRVHSIKLIKQLF